MDLYDVLATFLAVIGVWMLPDTPPMLKRLQKRFPRVPFGVIFLCLAVNHLDTNVAQETLVAIVLAEIVRTRL